MSRRCEQLDSLAWRVLVVGLYGLSAGVAIGCTRYLWDQLGDTVEQLCRSTVTLWF